jgi:glycosyltransferase involved in cell wall biosynthesis
MKGAMTRLKVAIICQNYPPARFEGGISHYSALLARSLVHMGHEVHAFTSSEFSEPTKDNTSQFGVEITRIDGPWNHSTVAAIKKLAERHKFDALVLQYAPASYKTSFRIRWALTRFACQKITVFHTLWGQGIDRLIALFLLVGSPKIIATNSEIMAILERHIPFLLKRTYWIPIGSNILVSNRVTAANDQSPPIVSFFGMIYPGKGMDVLLDVAEAVKNKGYQFQLKLIGGSIIYHPAFHEEFLNKIRQKRLESVVDYLGMLPAEEVSKRLQMSRFLYLPYDSGLSDRRGTFMAALEHGKPVLTAPPIVPMPFIKNGLHALWPKKADVVNYTELFIKLLTDDESLHRLEQGAKGLSSSFTWERIASELDLVLRR